MKLKLNDYREIEFVVNQYKYSYLRDDGVEILKYEPESEVEVNFNVSLQNEIIDDFCDELTKFIKKYLDKYAF